MDLIPPSFDKSPRSGGSGWRAARGERRARGEEESGGPAARGSPERYVSPPFSLSFFLSFYHSDSPFSLSIFEIAHRD